LIQNSSNIQRQGAALITSKKRKESYNGNGKYGA